MNSELDPAALDFYDFLVIRPGCLGIVVADVTGHGVPAALVASMVKVAVSAHMDATPLPGIRRCCSGNALREPLLELNESGLLLGVRSSEEYEQTEFTLEGGDRLLVYTDGLVEAVNARGEAFGEGQLGEFIATHQDLPAEQFAVRLLDKVLGWPENVDRVTADRMTVKEAVERYLDEITPTKSTREPDW